MRFEVTCTHSSSLGQTAAAPTTQTRAWRRTVETTAGGRSSGVVEEEDLPRGRDCAGAAKELAASGPNDTE